MRVNKCGAVLSWGRWISVSSGRVFGWPSSPYRASVWGAKGLIRLASPAAWRFNSSLCFHFFFLFLLCTSQKKDTHTLFVLCARKPRRLASSAVRGSEVDSLSCEGLGGSNPLSGPLETLLRASYRELQPPAIQNIPTATTTSPVYWAEGGDWKRLTRVNHIREVEKQRARHAIKLLGRREEGCCRCGITCGVGERRTKLNRKLFAGSLVRALQ